MEGETWIFPEPIWNRSALHKLPSVTQMQYTGHSLYDDDIHWQAEIYDLYTKNMNLEERKPLSRRWLEIKVYGF